jgi:acyl-CoA reductase-like NAD-dependent aldehyde dehydrogenase
MFIRLYRRCRRNGLIGGPDRGWYVEPMMFAGVKPNAVITEIFGSVLAYQEEAFPWPTTCRTDRPT